MTSALLISVSNLRLERSRKSSSFAGQPSEGLAAKKLRESSSLSSTAIPGFPDTGGSLMKSAKTVLLVAAIILLAGTAHAQTVRWSYVEGGGASIDPDRGDRENGWFVGGSVGLGKVPIHLIGDFASMGSLDTWLVGGGWHGLLGEKADLFADGAFYDVDVDDGFKVRFGVRWMLSERFELNGYLAWTELDFSDNKSIAGNLIYDLTGSFGIGGGAEWGDNWRFGRVFVRFSFGGKS